MEKFKYVYCIGHPCYEAKGICTHPILSTTVRILLLHTTTNSYYNFGDAPDMEKNVCESPKIDEGRDQRRRHGIAAI